MTQIVTLPGLGVANRGGTESALVDGMTTEETKLARARRSHYKACNGIRWASDLADMKANITRAIRARDKVEAQVRFVDDEADRDAIMRDAYSFQAAAIEENERIRAAQREAESRQLRAEHRASLPTPGSYEHELYMARAR